MSYFITKTKERVKMFFTVEQGRSVWTNKQSQAMRFANKKSAQMLIDADWVIPGKDKGAPELC